MKGEWKAGLSGKLMAVTMDTKRVVQRVDQLVCWKVECLDKVKGEQWAAKKVAEMDNYSVDSKENLLVVMSDRPLVDW